jgi:ankyrin repeat protein
VNGGEWFIPPLVSAMHNVEVVEYLLEKGADINNPRDPLRSPIYVACAGANKEVIKRMVKFGRIDDSLLFHIQDEIVARRLILLGANLNVLNSSMQTPLSWSVENRRYEVFFSIPPPFPFSLHVFGSF